MKKSQIFLFFLRLFFYFSATALILLHPGIAVSFDRSGVMQWFVIIPMQAFIAFVPFFKTGKFAFTLRNRLITSALTLFTLSVWAGGFGPGALPLILAGLVSFTLTFLLFNHPRWAKPAALEPFFLAWVCLRLLAFSRSGEDAAGQSLALTQFVFIWTGVIFLFHGIVIYFCLYPHSFKKMGREGAALIFSFLAVFLVVLFVLPPDFVRNKIIENLVQDKMPEKIKDPADDGLPKGDNGDRMLRRTTPRGGKDGNPELRGISEDNWPAGRTGRGKRGTSTDSKQYTVMVTASPRGPVYMGDSFRGQLDPVEGFLVSENEPLNRVAAQRHFVTWFNNEPDYDIGREAQEVYSLSTLPQKYLPYKPQVIDPTILSQNSGPLRYIHQLIAKTHLGDPLQLVNVPTRQFSSFEKSMLSSYFEINLDEADKKLLEDYLDSAFKNWQRDKEWIIKGDDYLTWIFYGDDLTKEKVGGNEYLEKIFAILTGFSEYQYNLSYNDTYAIATLKEFLFNTKDGDCVEFSNSAALLARVAGIPSRVVTGYLADKNLMTKAHMQGLAALREKIPELQRFRINDLYLVTNLARHSWVQFYIPDYGWLDFEATSFSIPPQGMGDFNNWDVVIPLIDENRIFSHVKNFPWRAVLRAAAILAALALICAYILRYTREIVLFIGARHGGRAGARSLYLLLLARLAADGKPIKPASKTAHEYSNLFQPQKNLYNPTAEQHFKNFATLYSELRWREFPTTTESAARFSHLKQEYKSILQTTRRPGLSRWFIRLISLRGLAYL